MPLGHQIVGGQERAASVVDEYRSERQFIVVAVQYHQWDVEALEWAIVLQKHLRTQQDHAAASAVVDEFDLLGGGGYLVEVEQLQPVAGIAAGGLDALDDLEEEGRVAHHLAVLLVDHQIHSTRRRGLDLGKVVAAALRLTEDEIPCLIADTGSAVQYHGYGGRGQVQPLGQFFRCDTHIVYLICS